MALIPIARPWADQPQVTTRPTHAPFRVAFSWLGSAASHDVETGSAWTRSASLTDIAGSAGRGVRFAGSTTNAFTRSGISTAAEQRFTALAVFSWTSGGANNFQQLLGTSTANSGYRFASPFSGTDLGIVKGGVANLNTITLSSGVIYVAVASHRTDTGEYYIVARPYGGGALLRTSGTNTSAAFAGNGTAGVGIARTDFAGAWNGDIYAASAGFDWLPESAAYELLDNPWQVFEPRRIWVPVPAGGGGSVSLIVADATHGHSADTIALTSQTALSVSDALHAHTVDAPTLSTLWVLALSDALHAHAADAVTLTTDSALAVSEALHAHAADNVTLEVAGATNLVVSEALHAHTVDALALTSAHALVVADATHGHAADGITLTAQSVLALQDALHAHAADNITLDASGAIPLLLADALHAHTADGLALTVDAWLVVADATHAHLADAVVLTLPGAFEPLDAPMFARMASAIARRVGAQSPGGAARRLGGAALNDPAAH